LGRKLKSFIITLFIYLGILIIFLFIKIHLATVVERTISITLMEDKGRGHKWEKSGNVIEAGGIGEGSVPLPYPSGKPTLPFPKKPVPPVSSIEKGNGKKPYSITGELSKRRLIKFVKPVYPEGKLEQTMVSLSIVVDKDGNVKRINVVKTGGNAFDKNAIRAIQDWKFQPLPSNETRDETGIVNIYFLLK